MAVEKKRKCRKTEKGGRGKREKRLKREEWNGEQETNHRRKASGRGEGGGEVKESET